jgi:hypothetical protein
MGVGAVNGFHVHAVGWVLAFNARALSSQEAHELSGLWAELVRARAEDRSRAPLLSRLLQPRSIPLSEQSARAFAHLVEHMAAMHPERFGCDALRRRRDQWALQVALSFLLGFLAAICLPKGSPLTGDVVLTFFVLGSGLLVPTAMLWRAASAVENLRALRHWRWSSPHTMSSRFR